MAIAVLACVLYLSALVPFVTPRDAECYQCRGEPSLDKCGTAKCISGPECYLSISEDEHGNREFHGGCNTPEFCSRVAWNPDYRKPSGKVLCNQCCIDKDKCVPELCHQALKAPEFRLKKGLQCEVCTGGTCGIYPGKDPVIQCPDELPYCMNVIQNEANGNKHLSKICASETDCENLWWNKSSQQAECMNFDPANIYNSTFEFKFHEEVKLIVGKKGMQGNITLCPCRYISMMISYIINVYMNLNPISASTRACTELGPLTQRLTIVLALRLQFLNLC